MINAVLFDLDGTFADTAPDLGYALNCQRMKHGLPVLSLEVIRPEASNGARGLLRVGFGMAPEDAGYASMREEFLQLYAENLFRDTRLFPGIEKLLRELDRRGLPWGIVTNKPHRFTLPLLENLQMAHRAACIISGDSTAYSKPHPEPLLAAARAISIPPNECVYVGDDKRDIDACHAAGMHSVVAKYGYLGNGTDPVTWGADRLIERPEDLLNYL